MNKEKTVLKTADEMFETFCIEKEHAKEVVSYAQKLFDAMNSSVCNFTKRDNEYLICAAKLHDIGYHIEKKSHHKHSMNMIISQGLVGFDETETKIIGCIARYHRNALPDISKHKIFATLSSANQELVKKLASILKLADGFDKPHKNLILRIRAQETEKSIVLYLKTVGFKPNLKMAHAKKDLFEYTFNKKLNFIFE